MLIAPNEKDTFSKQAANISANSTSQSSNQSLQRNQKLLAKHGYFFNYNSPALPQLNQLLAAPSLHMNQQINGSKSLINKEHTIDEQRLQKFEKINEAIERSLSRETSLDISTSLQVLKESLKDKRQLPQDQSDSEICQKTDKCQLQISELQRVQQKQDNSLISLGKRTQREGENIKEPILEVRDEETQKSWADISCKSSQSQKSLLSQAEQPLFVEEKVSFTINTAKNIQSKNFEKMVQNRISNQSKSSIKRKRNLESSSSSSSSSSKSSISSSSDLYSSQDFQKFDDKKLSTISKSTSSTSNTNQPNNNFICSDIQQSHIEQKLDENIGNFESQENQEQLKEKEVEEQKQQKEILLQQQPQDQLQEQNKSLQLDPQDQIIIEDQNDEEQEQEEVEVVTFQQNTVFFEQLYNQNQNEQNQRQSHQSKSKQVGQEKTQLQNVQKKESYSKNLEIYKRCLLESIEEKDINSSLFQNLRFMTKFKQIKIVSPKNEK
eukprot:403368360